MIALGCDDETLDQEGVDVGLIDRDFIHLVVG